MAVLDFGGLDSEPPILDLATQSLTVHTLRVYTLGVYRLGPLILDLATQHLGSVFWGLHSERPESRPTGFGSRLAPLNHWESALLGLQCEGYTLGV